MSTEKRKPTWTLCVKEGERWRAIGAAWGTERGNLYVRLNDGEVLRGTAMFFPYRERPPLSGGTKYRPAARPLPPSSDDYMDQKRAERAGRAPVVPTTPLNQDDDACPDPEAPDWL